MAGRIKRITKKTVDRVKRVANAVRDAKSNMKTKLLLASVRRRERKSSPSSRTIQSTFINEANARRMRMAERTPEQLAEFEMRRQADRKKTANDR